MSVGSHFITRGDIDEFSQLSNPTVDVIYRNFINKSSPIFQPYSVCTFVELDNVMLERDKKRLTPQDCLRLPLDELKEILEKMKHQDGMWFYTDTWCQMLVTRYCRLSGLRKTFLDRLISQFRGNSYLSQVGMKVLRSFVFFDQRGVSRSEYEARIWYLDNVVYPLLDLLVKYDLNDSDKLWIRYLAFEINSPRGYSKAPAVDVMNEVIAPAIKFNIDNPRNDSVLLMNPKKTPKVLKGYNHLIKRTWVK